jgi:hypothetical protein
LLCEDAGLIRLLAEGEDREDGGDDRECSEDCGGYGGDLAGEVARHGGRLLRLRRSGWCMPRDIVQLSS